MVVELKIKIKTVIACLILVFVQVHRKYNALVLTAFNNDSGFVASLDKVPFLLLINASASCLGSEFPLMSLCYQACGKFINNNAVTKHASQSSKSPELLAK